MSTDAARALAALRVTRPATVVRVHPFVIRHGVGTEAAALADALAVHAGVVMPVDDLRRRLAAFSGDDLP